MRVSPCHINIGDGHLACLVTVYPLWSGEIALVIRELYALDQPLGKPLLRDGFTLVSSIIGDEELGSALLPDITGSLQVLITSTSDTESAKCPIFLMGGSRVFVKTRGADERQTEELQTGSSCPAS